MASMVDVCRSPRDDWRLRNFSISRFDLRAFDGAMLLRPSLELAAEECELNDPIVVVIVTLKHLI